MCFLSRIFAFSIALKKGGGGGGAEEAEAEAAAAEEEEEDEWAGKMAQGACCTSLVTWFQTPGTHIKLEGKSQCYKIVLISTCTLTHVPTHKLLTHTLIINFKLRMNHSYGLHLL